ncbi:hypothetical protein PGTUg99_005601 [Puccinia graminis f. sp. tritici]|uniref:Uncharacterized protein n=1 Tax=Puccinia graminis f. sp. tritici TaxID=56615 RepID=A0A5B0P909_PUCGR|nr:hypothetical protein PGTUg99_005601 [Puccinia graminis f. sp. tritici]
MINLINSINGNIRHSSRQVQLHRVYGTVTLETTNELPQLTISVTNKHHSDVRHYMDTFGGNIYFDSSQNGYYK